MNLPTVSKASKRNLRKKLSRYANKKVKLVMEKETTPILGISDNKDDKSNQYGENNLPYKESEEIFYNPNKVS